MQGSKLGLCSRHHLSAGFAIRHVSADIDCFATRRFNLLHQLSACVVVQIHDNDSRSFFCKEQARFTPDSARATRDQRDFSLQSHVGLLSCWIT
jgi:hypothetical protein